MGLIVSLEIKSMIKNDDDYEPIQFVSPIVGCLYVLGGSVLMITFLFLNLVPAIKKSMPRFNSESLAGVRHSQYWAGIVYLGTFFSLRICMVFICVNNWGSSSKGQSIFAICMSVLVYCSYCICCMYSTFFDFLSHLFMQLVPLISFSVVLFVDLVDESDKAAE